MPGHLQISFGYGRVLSLPRAANRESEVLEVLAVPEGKPLANVPQAVADALESPLEYPPLSTAVVPGDRVALAVHGTVPRAEIVVSQTAEYLFAAGILPTDLTVLWAGSFRGYQSFTREFSDRLPAEVSILRYHPRSGERLAFLAASTCGKPFYFPRALVDADFVLPIGATTGLTNTGYEPLIYPRFSSLAARRLRTKSSDPDESQRLDQEACRQLGIFCTLAVVPGGGENVLAVTAGDSASVRQNSTHQFRAAWSILPEHEKDLVVASVSGSPGQQTWKHLQRAMATAAHFTKPGGTIILLTELAGVPRTLRNGSPSGHDHAAVLRAVFGSFGQKVAGILDRHPVFLLSRLPADLVESIGMAPLAAPRQALRLVKSAAAKSWLVIPHAAYVFVEGATADSEFGSGEEVIPAARDGR